MSRNKVVLKTKESEDKKLRKLKMTFGEEEIFATLLEDKAPGTIAALEKVLPYEARMHHAKICENEVFCRVPAEYDKKENPEYSVPGHISFFNFRQTVCLWYGDMKPLGYSNLFATVDEEYMTRLAPICEAIWKKQGEIVRLEFVEVPEV